MERVVSRRYLLRLGLGMAGLTFGVGCDASPASVKPESSPEAYCARTNTSPLSEACINPDGDMAFGFEATVGDIEVRAYLPQAAPIPSEDFYSRFPKPESAVIGSVRNAAGERVWVRPRN